MNSPAMQETLVQFLGQEDLPKNGQATHPEFLGFACQGKKSAGKESTCNAGDLGSIPGFDPWVGKIPWKKAWQPTPVFLPE